MKKKVLLFSVLLLALFLAACGDHEDEDEAESVEDSIDLEQEEPEEVEITDEEIIEEDTAVVSVNGNEVMGDKYNNIYREIKMQRHMAGNDISDVDALREETIDSLTILELIHQDALDSEIEVTEEEAQEEMDSIIETNGEEVIETMLAEYELTEEEFREQIIEDLTRIRYIETEFEVEVTDEEVKEQYDLLEEEHGEIGELEENEDLIREMVTQQKQGEMLEARIDELLEDAEVETFI